MGWDAYSEHGPYGKKWPAKSRREFKKACDRVVAKHGSCDWLLERGGLDLSSCAYALEEATGASAWDEDGWEPKKVKRLAKNAQWPETMDSSQMAAREFLETCARLGLRIDFSW